MTRRRPPTNRRRRTDAPVTRTCHTLRHHPVGPASRCTTARTGRIKKASSILVMKPEPTRFPARTATGLCAARAPARWRRSPRCEQRQQGVRGLADVIAATGVRATTRPPRTAASALNQRGSTGRRGRPWPRLEGLRRRHAPRVRPKLRAEISIGHEKAGGLSIVMKLDKSEEPKKNAFQLWCPPGPRPIEGVGPSAGAEVPQIEDGRGHEQREEGGAHQGASLSLPRTKRATRPRRGVGGQVGEAVAAAAPVSGATSSCVGGSSTPTGASGAGVRSVVMTPPSGRNRRGFPGGRSRPAARRIGRRRRPGWPR